MSGCCWAAARCSRTSREQSELLAWLRGREVNNARRHGVEQLARTVLEMGVLERMPFQTQPSREEWLARSQAGEIDVPPVWLGWTRRWFETSTLSLATRRTTYYAVIKAGRWLHAEHPDRADPASWDRELAAEWIATVQRLKIGELSKSLNANAMRVRYGEVLSPRSKASLIGSIRTFFCDLQEWEWIERRFDPRRALGIPRSILALIAPDPRVIADEVWAKLMWAGLNLEQDDLPKHGSPVGTGAPWYPLELVRAVALLWLFAGLRVDEILRLRVGAIRWQTTPDSRRWRAGVSAGRADEQDHQRVHQAGRPARRRRDRGVAGRPTAAAEAPRSQDRRAGRHAARLPRRAARLQVHQPGARPAAVPQGRRPARGRARPDHQPPRHGRRSRPSSTTPKTR